MKSLMRAFYLFFIFIFSLLNILNAAAKNISSNQNGWIRWTYETNGIVYASPVIENMVLYIGSKDGNFYALDANTGEKIWSFTSAGQIYTTAVIYDSKIYFKGAEILYALNLDGTLFWEKTLSDGTPIYQNDNWDYYHSSPVIYNNAVYIGTEKGKLFGFDLKTGDIVFEAVTSTNSTIETTPVIFNNRIFIGDFKGVMSVFNLVSGVLEWEYDTNDDKDFSPAWANHINTNVRIFNNNLYFGGKNCRMYTLKPESGELVTQYIDPNDQWLVGGPIIDSNFLYFGSSNQKVIHKVNALTSELIWKKNVDARIFGTPLIIDNAIFFGTGMEPNNSVGSFYALDKESGQLINSHPINAQLHSSPSYSNGFFYFGSADKKIYAIDKEKFLSGIWCDE